jgi:hypothetical protein
MRVLLVRHASAGDSRDWDGDRWRGEVRPERYYLRPPPT